MRLIASLDGTGMFEISRFLFSARLMFQHNNPVAANSQLAVTAAMLNPASYNPTTPE